jgi:RNA polymerase sigma factor (sigma-70 family)
VDADLDDRLMTALQTGDVSRLALLFERHHRALFNFFLRLTADRQASEDLVQDVFLRILKYHATYRPGSQFRAWMYQLARHAYLDRRKPASREVPLDALVSEPPSPALHASDALQQDQQAALVRRALARLPEDKREVLVLSRYQGLSYEQVGTLLGIEVGAVKVRVYRAVRALRAILLDLSGESSSCRANS